MLPLQESIECVTSILGICYPQLMFDPCVHIPQFRPGNRLLSAPQVPTPKPAPSYAGDTPSHIRNHKLQDVYSRRHSRCLHQRPNSRANTSKQFTMARQRNWSGRDMLSTQYRRSKQTAERLISPAIGRMVPILTI